VTKLLNAAQTSRLIGLTSLCALSLTTVNALAETVNTEEWQITADKLTRYEDPKSIIAEGNVVLTKLEQLPPALTTQETKNKQWAELLEEPTPIAKSTTGGDVDKDAPPRYETKVTIQADWIAYDVDPSL